MDIEYRNAPWDTLAEEFPEQADLIICDPIYENEDLSYIETAIQCLRPGGALWVFSDASGVAQTKVELDKHLKFMNWIIWENDWGGRPRNRFGQKHDDILYYTKKGPEPHTFNASAVAIPKKMTNQAFNPSGRTTKIPASVWSDLAGFSTMASERVHLNGHCVRWQKPKKLLERIILSSSNPGDLVLDFFSGVATAPVVCLELDRRCVATEVDKAVYGVGVKRLDQARLDAETKV